MTLFNYDYCAVCFHRIHIGQCVSHDEPFGNVCGCDDPVTEDERGARKVIELPPDYPTYGQQVRLHHDTVGCTCKAACSFDDNRPLAADEERCAYCGFICSMFSSAYGAHDNLCGESV